MEHSFDLLFITFDFYTVNDGRKSWIDIIKNHQPINENIQLYVCDLHFNPSDIRMGRTKSTLRRGAVPNIKYVPRFTVDSEDYIRMYLTIF